jgi:hypothetical protein
VSTNWPTVALKPDRNALNGYTHHQPISTLHHFLSVKEMPCKTYVVPDNNAIYKLQRTDCDQEGHEAVNELHALRGPVQIVLPYAIKDLVCACCVLEVGAGLRATDGL